MAAAKGDNLPPIIVKKVTVVEAGHHGGAWKVAYADFVTAMMAFFLLLWLLGATTEDQRKGLADYFTPMLVKTKEQSAGADGVWRVRYAGPQQVDLRSRQRAGSAAAASNTLSMDADAMEARQFALEMHEASVPENELLAHARAVLRRYHVFYQVTEHDVKLASSSA